jgi:predicted  nucleic acid-binding Zn-ribbon protein
MKLVLLKAAAERLEKARRAHERAERELRAAEAEMQRVRAVVEALGIDPDKLDDATSSLEQEILAATA